MPCHINYLPCGNVDAGSPSVSVWLPAFSGRHYHWQTLLHCMYNLFAFKVDSVTNKKGRVFFGYFFPCSSQGFGAFLSAVCFMYLTTKVLSVSWKIPCKNLGFFRYSTSHFLFYCRQKIEIITSVRALSVSLFVCQFTCLSVIPMEVSEE